MIDTLQVLFNKYREQIMYLIFGVITTIVGVVTFELFCGVFGLNELISNVISWILAVLFAFITNRNYVFCQSDNSKKSIIKQMTEFFSARLFTLGVEEIIIYVFITILGYNRLIVKICAQFIVIVLNYILSKLIVFKK